MKRLLSFGRCCARVALLSVVAFGGAALAQSPTWPYAIASGSQRLALMALLRDQPAGADAVTAGLIAAQGFAPDAGADLSWSVVPGVAWEDNLNGGIPAQSLRLYGLNFVIDEASRAKSGLTPTLSMGISARKTLAPGAVVQVYALASGAYSLDHHLGKADIVMGACSGHSLEADWFMDICLRQTRRLRDLGNTTERLYSVGFEKLLALGNSLHSVTIRPQIEEVDRRARPMIGMDWVGIYPDLGILSLSVLGGPAPAGYGGVTGFASIGIKRDLLGAVTGVSLSAETAAGQSYLGLAREDETYTLRLSRQMGQWGDAQVGYRKRLSSIPGFEDTAFLLGFDFKGWDG